MTGFGHEAIREGRTKQQKLLISGKERQWVHSLLIHGGLGLAAAIG
jgi:hypothetical protein